LGTCLAALSRAGADRGATETLEAVQPQGIADLEELLAQGAGSGTLLLDGLEVPVEDIGIVRRFLERNTGWRLLVVASDPAEPAARALLALRRARCVPWPPDLEQLDAWIRELTAPGPGPRDAETPSAPVPPAPARRPARPERESVDLGALLEERLAGLSLEGRGGPRYLYRHEGGVVLPLARAPLADALAGLLALAGVCAGPGGVVSARVDPERDAEGRTAAARVRIEFPAGPLTDADLHGLLDPAAAARELPAELAPGVAAAREAAAMLAGLGGSALVSARDDGRLRLELHLGAPPPARAPAPRPRPRRAEAGGSAGDPFA